MKSRRLMGLPQGQGSPIKYSRSGPCIAAKRATYVRFSNRPFRVKRFQTIHLCGVDVAHGLVLLFGIVTRGPSIMGFEDEVEQSIGRFNGCGAVRLGRSSRRGLTT